MVKKKSEVKKSKCDRSKLLECLKNKVNGSITDLQLYSVRDNDLVTFKIQESPTFAELKKISEVFGTDEIDFSDRSHGCSTCGYGSSTTIQVNCVKKWPKV